jgi:hypothetical protein
MPTFAADQELDRLEVEREAWTAYRSSLAELTGREYELAEEEAWEQLQRTLSDIPR